MEQYMYRHQCCLFCDVSTGFSLLLFKLQIFFSVFFINVCLFVQCSCLLIILQIRKQYGKNVKKKLLKETKLNEKLYILSGLRFIIYLSFNANSTLIRFFFFFFQELFYHNFVKDESIIIRSSTLRRIRTLKINFDSRS